MLTPGDFEALPVRALKWESLIYCTRLLPRTGILQAVEALRRVCFLLSEATLLKHRPVDHEDAKVTKSALVKKEIHSRSSSLRDEQLAWPSGLSPLNEYRPHARVRRAGLQACFRGGPKGPHYFSLYRPLD